MSGKCLSALQLWGLKQQKLNWTTRRPFDPLSSDFMTLIIKEEINEWLLRGNITNKHKERRLNNDTVSGLDGRRKEGTFSMTFTALPRCQTDLSNEELN